MHCINNATIQHFNTSTLPDLLLANVKDARLTAQKRFEGWRDSTWSHKMACQPPIANVQTMVRPVLCDHPTLSSQLIAIEQTNGDKDADRDSIDVAHLLQIKPTLESMSPVHPYPDHPYPDGSVPGPSVPGLGAVPRSGSLL